LRDWGQRAKRLGRSLGAYTPAEHRRRGVSLVQASALLVRRPGGLTETDLASIK
jgi:hypothetical protein